MAHVPTKGGRYRKVLCPEQPWSAPFTLWKVDLKTDVSRGQGNSTVCVDTYPTWVQDRVTSVELQIKRSTESQPLISLAEPV
jgi:hypothetical protein